MKFTIDDFAKACVEDDVNVERDRRLIDGFEFQGVVIQADDRSLIRLSGASLNASLAIQSGAQAGDLRWADPDTDFSWIAANNALLTLDAFQMIALGIAAAEYVNRLTKKARELKDRIASGERIINVTLDSIWTE